MTNCPPRLFERRSCTRVCPRRATGAAQRARTFLALAALIFTLLCAPGGFGYSVLTHEEIVDLLWPDKIRPLVLAHYPGLTEEQIKQAHAFAYGGSVIQDLGYYPFGSKQFSDLVHYVRSGDFVAELIAQSRDANEFAFALGALAHYAADIDGHPAVNRAVAIEYPKLRRKFGPVVLYADDRTAHLKTEFGFDTVQVAKRRYAPEQYHDFIGFQVALPLLQRAFPVVYGMSLKDVLKHEELAVGSYRFAIGNMIPKLTQVALQVNKKQLTREIPNFAKQKFLYHLSRADYERYWGKTYRRPGFGTRFLAFVLRLVPKVGPFKALAFNHPTTQTEDLYIRSIDRTVEDYRNLLDRQRAGAAQLPNYDLDSGNPTQAAEYSLADDTYADLLAELSAGQFGQTSPELRNNLLEFYSDPSLPIDTRKHPKRWQSVFDDLKQLRAAGVQAGRD